MKGILPQSPHGKPPDRASYLGQARTARLKEPDSTCTTDDDDATRDGSPETQMTSLTRNASDVSTASEWTDATGMTGTTGMTRETQGTWRTDNTEDDDELRPISEQSKKIRKKKLDRKDSEGVCAKKKNNRILVRTKSHVGGQRFRSDNNYLDRIHGGGRRSSQTRVPAKIAKSKSRMKRKPTMMKQKQTSMLMKAIDPRLASSAALGKINGMTGGGMDRKSINRTSMIAGKTKGLQKRSQSIFKNGSSFRNGQAEIICDDDTAREMRDMVSMFNGIFRGLKGLTVTTFRLGLAGLLLNVIQREICHHYGHNHVCQPKDLLSEDDCFLSTVNDSCFYKYEWREDCQSRIEDRRFPTQCSGEAQCRSRCEMEDSCYYTPANSYREVESVFWLVTVLRTLVSVTTFTLMWKTVWVHKYQLAYRKMNRLYMASDTVWSSITYYGPLLIELLILLVHEPPMVDIQLDILQADSYLQATGVAINTPAWLNNPWGIFMFLRLYLVLRYIRGMYYSGGSRIIGIWHDFQFSTGFMVRNLLHTNPVRTLVPVSLGCIAVMAYWLYICERTVAEEKGSIRSFWDAIWVLFVTFTTVGYGDRTPLTYFGRLVCILAGILSVILTAAITATALQKLALMPYESQMVEFLEHATTASTLRRHAARIIQAAWRFRKKVKRNNEVPAAERDSIFLERRRLTDAITIFLHHKNTVQAYDRRYRNDQLVRSMLEDITRQCEEAKIYYSAASQIAAATGQALEIREQREVRSSRSRGVVETEYKIVNARKSGDIAKSSVLKRANALAGKDMEDNPMQLVDPKSLDKTARQLYKQQRRPPPAPKASRDDEKEAPVAEKEPPAPVAAAAPAPVSVTPPPGGQATIAELRLILSRLTEIERKLDTNAAAVSPQRLAMPSGTFNPQDMLRDSMMNNRRDKRKNSRLKRK